jgi:hypothetical protein
MFLILILILLYFPQVAQANPYHHIWIHQGDVPPDVQTKPPQIRIDSPADRTLFATDNIAVFLNVKVGDSSTGTGLFLQEIYYKADWLANTTTIYNYDLIEPIDFMEPPRITEFSQTINLTGIPDGNHSVIFYALEKGMYITDQGPPGSGLNVISFAYYYKSFEITGGSSLRFTVDTTAPVVTVLGLDNKVFVEGEEIALNFTTTETASKMAYALDGQEKVLINENSTLPVLTEGTHTVTVYAWDAAGNVGVSEEVVFRVKAPESFPTITVASAVAIAVACVGLMFYFRKR